MILSREKATKIAKELSKKQIFLHSVLKTFEVMQDTTSDILKDYADKQAEILADYVASAELIAEIKKTNDDLLLELAEADKMLRDEITEFELDARMIADYLEDHDLDKDENEELLDRLDTDGIKDEITGGGSYILIRTDNFDQQQRIEDFVKENIYPFDNDQRDKIEIG